MMMRKMVLGVALGLCCFGLMAAEKSPEVALTYKLEKDLPYVKGVPEGVDGDYLRERGVLDVYYAENGRDLPVVLWFHGGGLRGGKKHLPDGLKDKKMVVVMPNYRLHPRAKCADSIADAAAALAWTFENASKYGGDPAKIFVSGHSAGGYLAMMIGLDRRWMGAHGIDISRIAGLVPLSGHTITHMTIRTERNIPHTQPVIDEFAPLFHVGVKNPPPLLLITGDREMEMLGRYEENAYMMRMMKLNKHNDVTLYELQGYGHGMTSPGVPLLVKFVNERSAAKK